MPPPGGWPPPQGPPPGAPAWGYGYAPGAPPVLERPLGGLATALTVVLAVAAAAALGMAAALANRAAVLEDGFAADFDDVTRADDLAQATAGAYLLAMLVAAVLWIVWQYRHAQNAESLGARLGLGSGWAIAGWLVPLANIVLGPLQLVQSAQASDPDVPGGRGRAPAVVWAWWALWVAQAVAGVASGRFGFGDDLGNDVDLDTFRRSDQVGAVGALVTVAAAIAAIVVVRLLSARQRQAFAARGSAPRSF